MGVPALFRWLSKKYPKIISPVVEDLPEEFENGNGTKTKIPIDARGPNPNGEEFDNLYLDMNGIVHPCSHPEDRPPPANEEEMMIAVFEYTERVVNMVRPRKLLMIAVDGVAPRAKMNQQRSRRFRSAQEAADKDKENAQFYANLKASGQQPEGDEDGEKAPTKTWDSNAITPGTPFMDTLAASLRYWVSYKCSTDPAWEKLKIIISDATVPGEGEHKIMNFVRSQRVSPHHDPNTRHVIYGLDADLIMLGLATHEPHFRVLREDVFANDTKPGHCRICNQPGHMAANCRGVPAKKPGEEVVEKPLKPFIWLHVSILREYLAVEMNVPGQPFNFDLERALDDWVFMCFFVGNDFLPHLPSLDIREDGIDTLIAIWRDNIPTMGGYVTEDGNVNLGRAQIILNGLASQENAIFKRRKQVEDKRAANERRREESKAKNKHPRYGTYGQQNIDETVIQRGARGGIRKGNELAPDPNALPMFNPSDAGTKKDPRFARNDMTHADVVGSNPSGATVDNRSAAAALKAQLNNKPQNPASTDPMAQCKVSTFEKNLPPGMVSLSMLRDARGITQSQAKKANRKRPARRTNDVQTMMDEAEREAKDEAVLRRPETDIKDSSLALGKRKADEFEQDISNGRSGALGTPQQTPQKPAGGLLEEDTVQLWEDGYEGRYYEQKFGVAPDDVEFRHKVARHYVEGLCWVLLYYMQGCPSWTWYYPYHYAPFAADFVDMDKQVVEFEKGEPFRPYEQLMGVMPARSNHTLPAIFHPLMTEQESPIIEFYPEDFAIDLNGKKQTWQGVALLPFIDEKRLLAAMHEKYPLLTADEARRNGFGDDALIFSTKHALYNDVANKFYSKKADTPNFKINPVHSEGLAGKISKNAEFVPNSSLEFPLPTTQDEFTSLDSNEAVNVHYSMPPIPGLHKSMLLPGIKFPDPVLDYDDVQKTRSMAAKAGRSFGGVQLSNNGGMSDGPRINYGNHQSNRGGYQGNNGYGGHSQTHHNPNHVHSNPIVQNGHQAATSLQGMAPPAAIQEWARQNGLPPPPAINTLPLGQVPNPRYHDNSGSGPYGGYGGGYGVGVNRGGFRGNHGGRGDGFDRGGRPTGYNDRGDSRGMRPPPRDDHPHRGRGGGGGGGGYGYGGGRGGRGGGGGGGGYGGGGRRY
ncbi:hypothetical protein MBLNU230_g7708t1 [Neophaeotheca triangularis]